MILTVTTPIYKNFNDLCRYEDSNIYSLPIDLNIEIEVICRLVGGLTEYKQLILDHTNENMFFDKSLKGIYKVIRDYVNIYGIKELDYNKLILRFKDIISEKRIDFIKDLKNHFDKFIIRLNDEYTCSANAKYWIENLHISYFNKIKDSSSYEAIKKTEKELEELKFTNTEIDLLEIGLKYSETYEDKQKNLIKTGYPSIDSLIGGLQGGNLFILAAATGMGKTATLLNIIINMAKKGKKVLMFSLEMKPEELFTRIASTETRINAERLRNRTLTNEELNSFFRYLGSQMFETLKNQITVHNKSSVSIS